VLVDTFYAPEAPTRKNGHLVALRSRDIDRRIRELGSVHREGARRERESGKQERGDAPKYLFHDVLSPHFGIRRLGEYG